MLRSVVALLMAMQLLIVFWSTTTFRHTHTLSNGRVITHSHIGFADTKTPAHAHTQKDYLFLEILLHAPVVEAIHVEFSFTSSVLSTLSFSCIQRNVSLQQSCLSLLRAPPISL